MKGANTTNNFGNKLITFLKMDITKITRKDFKMDFNELEAKVDAELAAVKNSKIVEAIDAEIEVLKTALVDARGVVDSKQAELDGLVAKRDVYAPPVVPEAPAESETQPEADGAVEVTEPVM